MASRVTIAIDFGTTFSGIAHAINSNPTDIKLPFKYPNSNSSYCKTPTALSYRAFFSRNYILESWGEQALQRNGSLLATGFKLQLAPNDSYVNNQLSPLHEGLSVLRVITDYLKEIGKFSLEEVREAYDSGLSAKHVQWVLTVPTIWDDSAKQIMKQCMFRTGLVEGPPPIIILEPEAAACFTYVDDLSYVEENENVLLIDVGGGTTDLVMQKKKGDEVQEVTCSSGGICGGIFVDKNFYDYLMNKIPCFEDRYDFGATIRKQWEKIKFNFGDSRRNFVLDLSEELSEAWEKFDLKNGNPTDKNYDEIDLTFELVKSFFDPVIEKILNLIRGQLDEVEGDCQFLVAVGGFSDSPYLKSRIRETFSLEVENIIFPPNPGAAICQGAVYLALKKFPIVSRVQRKSYGIGACRPFEEEIDPPHKLLVSRDTGVTLCRSRFVSFVRKGEHVSVDEEVVKVFRPVDSLQTSVKVVLYSYPFWGTPRYVDDEGVDIEHEIFVDIPDTSEGLYREIEVVMKFGTSMIEVTAKTENYGEELVVRMKPVLLGSSKKLIMT